MGLHDYETELEAAAVLSRIAAARSSDPASDDLTVPLAIECAEKDVEIGRLRAALKPLAAIALWSDSYPDCKADNIADYYNLRRYFTVDQIKAARKAFAEEANHG